MRCRKVSALLSDYIPHTSKPIKTSTRNISQYVFSRSIHHPLTFSNQISQNSLHLDKDDLFKLPKFGMKPLCLPKTKAKNKKEKPKLNENVILSREELLFYQINMKPTNRRLIKINTTISHDIRLFPFDIKKKAARIKKISKTMKYNIINTAISIIK